MLIILQLACIAPSLIVNVWSQYRIGAGPDVLIAVGAMVGGAPLFVARGAQSKWLARGFWWLLAAAFAVLNTLIALSAISSVRDAAMDHRAELQRRAASVEDIRSQISNLRKVAGTSTPAMIEAEIDAVPAWKRPKLQTKLEAAREIVRLEAKLPDWQARFEVPSSTDPGVANLIALVVSITDVKLNERTIAAWLSVAFALLLEVLADLGPIAVTFLGVRNPLPTTSKTTSKSAGESNHRLDSTLVSQPAVKREIIDEITAWQTTCLKSTSGSASLPAELLKSHNAWRRARGLEEISASAFGSKLRSLKLKRESGGLRRYLDVELVADKTLRAVK